MKRDIRILLVEDNVEESKLFELQLLKFQEFMISRKISIPSVALDIVGDGRLAKDYLLQQGDFCEKELPDLVLLDYYMPGMTGLELLLDLEQTPSYQMGYPIIMMMTWYEMNRQELLEFYRLGLGAILKKPRSMEDFAKMMNFWLHCITYAF